MKSFANTRGLAGSLLLAFLPAFAQPPLQIGYSNCVQVASYSPSLMQEIGKFRWFFAHASVGNNMMDGVDSLHGTDSSRYPYYRVWEDDFPPDSTQNGSISSFWRGNPGWSVKVDTFATYASNGWTHPKIHLAANKFCFVDQDADLDYYLASMTNLEAAFPEIVFVYMTIPLMTTTDENNVKRNVYNDALRLWTSANSRVLFDVADIEAHDTNGVPCLFTNNDRVCQRLADAYMAPDDDGHLNSQGKVLVALGFYAVSAALLAADRDHDGVSDGHELIAGTRPMDRFSVLKLEVLKASDGSVSLSCFSSTNRLYTLQRGTDLAVPGNLSTVVRDTAATPPLNTFTDSPLGPGPFFYRVQVRQ